MKYKGEDMDKKYEIALSYANGNDELAEVISNELDFTFDKAFFRDKLRKDELSKADSFVATLIRIFKNSRFAVVLYTEEYKKGMYAPVELKEIIDKSKHENLNNFFIIKADDSIIEEKEIKGAYYITLIPHDFNSMEEIHQRVSEIVQENIKTVMIKRSVGDKKEADKYKLNIHTIFDNGNNVRWLNDYDWNILGKKYVDKRDIKESYTWENLWDSIRTDFNLIQEELVQENKTTRVIHFNCHLSIAYKLGQIYGNLDQASTNRNLQLLSSNGKISFAFEKERGGREEKDFCVKSSGNDMMSTDIICIISIKSPKNEHILNAVKGFLKLEDQKYNSIYLFQDERRIESTLELESLADYIYNKMQSAYIHGKKCKFHLFLDTITPLAFVLGGRRPFSGDVQLYEYLETEAIYKKSLTRGLD